MSTTQDWTPSEALDTRLGQPDRLQFPDDWEYSRSWERVQTEHSVVVQVIARSYPISPKY